jgi:hypothetical protein
MPDEKPRQKQSPLDAIAAGRAGTRGNVTALGGGAAFGRPASRERTLTDEDMELLLDLGYENSLSQKVGAQRVETIKQRRMSERRDDRRLAGLYGCLGEEYTGHAQDETITAAYRKHVRAATVRQVFAFLLVLLVAQCISMRLSMNNSAIHDLISGTVVVDLAMQKVFNSSEELVEYTKKLHAERAARQDY